MSEDEKSDRDSPDYWIQQLWGTPMAIVIPPYIRFLQGSLLLRNALILLQRVQSLALKGNPILKETLTEIDQSASTKRLGLSYETYFASQLTINLVSEVEHFFGSAVSAALRMHPGKMGEQQFKLLDIISASSTDELINRAADSVINKLMYEKPNDYIKRLAEILSIDHLGLANEWPPFVELKSRRDLGIHNNWIVNEIYLRKIRDAKVSNSHKMGDRLTPDFAYLIEAISTCDKLVKKMADLLIQKWAPTGNQ